MLSVDSNKLYIADNSKIVIVDVNTDTIIKQLEVEGSKFLNDVTIDNKGIVYISDYLAKKI